MFDFMKGELFYNLGKLLDNNIISENTLIVCFGYNNHCKLTVSYLIGAGIKEKQLVIIDNYKDGEFKGIKVQKPKDVLEPYLSDVVILLATSYNKEMKKQLVKLGYKKQIYETLNIKSLVYKYGTRLRLNNPDKLNDIMESWGYKIYRSQYKEFCELTEKNIAFKNVHQGKRCFIMGNGPSVRNFNLELLKDEYVFGVNQIMSIPEWEKANINYWVCIDGNFLGMLNNSQYDFAKKLEVFEKREITGFVPVEARYYCKANNVDEYLNLNYINCKKQYVNLDKRPRIKKVDISQLMMAPYNVVIACINIAIYMGFSEIYLIGCEQSALKDELNFFFREGNVNMHAIDKKEDMSYAIFTERLRDKGMYFELRTQLVQLVQFSILNRFCKQHNIKLFNLCQNSLIQDIEKITVEEVGLTNEQI